MRILVPTDIDLEYLTYSTIRQIFEIIHYDIGDIDAFCDKAPNELEKIIRAIGEKLTKFDYEEWENKVSD